MYIFLFVGLHSVYVRLLQEGIFRCFSNFIRYCFQRGRPPSSLENHIVFSRGDFIDLLDFLCIYSERH